MTNRRRRSNAPRPVLIVVARALPLLLLLRTFTCCEVVARVEAFLARHSTKTSVRDDSSSSSPRWRAAAALDRLPRPPPTPPPVRSSSSSSYVALPPPSSALGPSAGYKADYLRESEEVHDDDEDDDEYDDGSSAAAVVSKMTPDEMLRDWFPLSFESYLDPAVPNPVLHMGRNLAVWRDGTTGEWNAVDDMCPHKLAPLSDGSIAEDGASLRCSYHGWRFDGCGSCRAIPSLPADAPISARCDVRSYPVRRTGSMLWIWMDPSVEPNWDSPRIKHAGDAWNLEDGYQRDLAYSWDCLFENILDPTHVAYAHFGLGKEFNRTEADEIREDHVADLRTRYADDGVQLRFNRTINGRNLNETWDFLYPGVWFLRRGGPDRGSAGVIMATPIDASSTRLMSTLYKPEVAVEKKKEKGALGKLKARLMKPLFTVIFHRTMNRFFNSDSFLIRYQQEMIARSSVGGGAPRDPLRDYELASPADRGTVAFRKWHLKRLGGELPMARTLTPDSKRETGSVAMPAAPLPATISRKDAADPWEQHTKNCPTCRGAHDVAVKVKVGSAVLAALLVLLRPSIGTAKSAAGTAALSFVSLRARRFARSFHEKGHVHGKMREK